MLAIYKFARSKLNKTFTILASSLCCLNLCMILPAVMNAIASVAPAHPLGHVGCTLSFAGVSTISMLTMWVQAIISYERRKAVTSVSLIVSINHNRVYILLALAVTFFILFSSIIYGVFDSITFLQVRIAKNSNETIHICSMPQLWFMGFIEILYSLIGFHLPIVSIVFNYL